MSKNDGGPAFPTGDVFNPDHGENGRVERGFNGMSLRDWFAGQWIASRTFAELEGSGWDEVAEQAYMASDAMLAEREK